MEVEVTYRQVKKFRQNVRQYLAAKNERTKFNYALTKMLDRTESVQNDINDKEQEIRIDLASVDKENILLIDKDTNAYRYTKENARKLQTKLRELDNEVVKIDCHQVDEAQIPKNLEAVWIEFFVPFVIAEPVE